jgi:membrane protein DedA with SNARE-associated domain
MEIPPPYGYAVVFGTVLAEQIGLPVPSEPVLLAAGGLVGTGQLRLVFVLALASVASPIGDTVWYWLGRTSGARVLGWLCRLSLEPDSCVRKTERVFATQGARGLVFAKFVPGLSTIAPPLAGVLRLPLRAFLGYSALSALCWSGAYLVIGWLFSAQIEMIAAFLTRLGGWAIALAGGAFGAYLLWKYIARQRFLRRIRMARITPEELKAMLDAGEKVMVVDVRDRVDFDAEPLIIPGALHFSVEELGSPARRDPARAGDRGVPHVTQRGLERPGGAAPPTPRHRARAAPQGRLPRLAKARVPLGRPRPGDQDRESALSKWEGQTLADLLDPRRERRSSR